MKRCIRFGWGRGRRWLVSLVFLPLLAFAGREVPNFALLDLQGHHHELHRSSASALVLFFTGTGCPIARKSSEKLRDLRGEFADRGVEFWIVNTYPEDSVGDATKEYHELGLHGLTYLRDPKQGVALALGVSRTAEVIAVDGRSHEVFYQGAIDDQYVEGGEKPRPTESYLRRALDEFLAGKPVATSRTRAHGCRLTFADRGAGEAPSYSSDVAPILRRRCVDCHRPGAIMDQLPWDGYARVRNNARMIEEVLLARRMPPWDPNPDFGRFAHDLSLSREETQTLLSWVNAGSPRGEGPDPLGEAMAPVPEWQLGRPDVVLRLPGIEEIPATGTVDYRHIAVANPFTNDVWVSGIEIKPDNRRVVHHVILYAKWPDCPDDGTGNGYFFCGWAPGSPPSKFPAGFARRLPAGAQLTMEMHYTTCGTPQTDRSEVALYLAPGPQARDLSVRAAVQLDIDIPPGTDEARHVATYAFRRSATLYSLTPHMHVRGKWMRYELLLPDGSKETLLHVPRYDFKWQHYYVLEKPRSIPAGAWMLVTGAYDNSAGKPGNPDPAKRVRSGLQSWDEMFIGFFEAADEPDLATVGDSGSIQSTASISGRAP